MDEDTTSLILMISLVGMLFSFITLEYGVIPFLFTLLFLGLLIGGILIVSTDVAFNSKQTEATNPVKTLQDQYARGELSDEEFNDKLDKLVEAQEIAEEVDEEEVDILKE